MHSRLLQLAACTLVMLSAATAADLAPNALYAAITNTQSYSTFVGPIPIDGLSVNLPAASGLYNAAIVTLSMPNLNLSAPSSESVQMSAQLELIAPFSPDGIIQGFGSIGCDTTRVTTSGMKPLTIVLKVPLGTTAQPVEAEWSALDNTVTTQDFASISAILIRE